MAESQTSNFRRWFTATKLLLATLTVALLFGGDRAPAQAASPAAAVMHRDRLELRSVPSKTTQILDLIDRLKKQSDATTARPELDEVAIVGRIGGMPNPWADSHPDFPWFAKQASFFLLDSQVADQFAKHAKSHGGGHNCAFCQRLAAKNAHAIAVVNLVDQNGAIVPIDSREVFPLAEGQSVVVRGRAELLGGTMLVIHAEGLAIRR